MTTHDLKIINARILTPTGFIPDGTIAIANGKIVAINDSDTDADVIIDAKQLTVCPGFIDLHVHGGGGFDFMDNTVGAFTGIAALHARYGTTSLVPTTLSSDFNTLTTTLETYEKAYPLNQNGAQFIGMHIEGPYVSMNQRGAQDPRYVKNPDPAEYRVIAERFDFIKRWSAAPELPGALEFAKYLTGKNILPAIAHTDATFDEVLEAFETGYTHVTHFYSCMSTVSRRNAYRYAGSVEAVYFLDDMTVEIIADGIHLPPSLLKLIYKLKGAENISLITDAMRAAGLPPGESILGAKDSGFKVIVEDGVAKLPDRSAFAGSVATCDKLVRNMINLAGIPFEDAIRMMTINPAKIMGVQQYKGTLEVGKDADMVILDEHLEVTNTIVGGKVVYTK